MGTNLASIWVGFGDQVKANLEPSVEKTVPQNVVKKHADWDRLFNDFCSILASNLGGQGGVKNRDFRYFLDAGRPRGAKMAPRGLQAQIF